ncbi:High-affinity glucose transporter ght1 [Talaromyces pinophilus]|nr:High-affinity glucose transporter ght1 [Talaromyces pinophilus]
MPRSKESPKGDRQTLKSMLNKMTPALFSACFITAMLNMLFGFDTTSFAGVQSIPAFERKFGTPTGDGGYGLSGSRASFMSSVAFSGKFFGTLTAPIFIELLGHRYTMWILCMISFVGIIIECTSHKVVQFVLGRIIVYYSVGLAENTSTTYQSEIVPAGLRGAIVGSIQLFIQFGQIFASGINKRFSTETKPKGWIIPVAVQAIVPVIIVFGAFLIPNAPRWLISKGRKEDAIRTLEKVRPKEDVATGVCKDEADAIEEALNNNVDKGPWIDLFKGTNLRRTTIAAMVFIFQQFTGQGFVSQYSPRFYKTVGLSENAFLYNIISGVVAWVGVLIGMPLSDLVGRRDLLIWGAVLQGIFLFSMAGIGTKSSFTTSDASGLVASVMLFNFFFAMTWAPIAYVVASEIGTASLREKTMAVTSTINVVAAFIVAFCVPYLLDDIGANIGWLFGAISFVAAIYAYFFVPEIKNRSLEELDELFENRISARKFASTQTHGAGRRVAELENRTNLHTAHY